MEHQFDDGGDAVATKAAKLHDGHAQAAKLLDGHEQLTTQAGYAGQEKALLKAVGIDAPPGSAEAVKAAKLVRHDAETKGSLDYVDPATKQTVHRSTDPGHGGRFDLMVVEKVADGHSLPEAHHIATIIAKMKAVREAS